MLGAGSKPQRRPSRGFFQLRESLVFIAWNLSMNSERLDWNPLNWKIQICPFPTENNPGETGLFSKVGVPFPKHHACETLGFQQQSELPCLVGGFNSERCGTEAGVVVPDPMTE